MLDLLEQTPGWTLLCWVRDVFCFDTTHARVVVEVVVGRGEGGVVVVLLGHSVSRQGRVPMVIENFPWLASCIIDIMQYAMLYANLADPNNSEHTQLWQEQWNYTSLEVWFDSYLVTECRCNDQRNSSLDYEIIFYEETNKGTMTRTISN